MGSFKISSTQSRGSPKGRQEKSLEGNKAREGCTFGLQHPLLLHRKPGSDRNTKLIPYSTPPTKRQATNQASPLVSDLRTQYQESVCTAHSLPRLNATQERFPLSSPMDTLWLQTRRHFTHCLAPLQTQSLIAPQACLFLHSTQCGLWLPVTPKIPLPPRFLPPWPLLVSVLPFCFMTV